MKEIGNIFGDMEIIEFVKKDKNYHKHYKVKCLKCGREKKMKLYVLKQERGIWHSSCGEGIKTLDKKFYAHWQNMRTRTNNPNYEHYKHYGGRGISSDTYIYFIDFYDDLYDSYQKHVESHGEDNTTLDRIDNDGNYELSNVRWATWEQQQSNTRRNRMFKAISPTGKIYKSINQSHFARTFNLSDKQINACLKGRFKTHLGWKFEYIYIKSVTTIENTLLRVKVSRVGLRRNSLFRSASAPNR